MKRILETILTRPVRRSTYRPRVITRTPELPMGFVRRTDPNFFFLARKF
ncbi:MAG TPA: hypothetical protein VHQ86_01020 [Candidatus Saccharimonadia bacterium]|jgi:hypothetical protein|nr:hypothetical protein [Candidatus Saccharimonadia bacterium]